MLDNIVDYLTYTFAPMLLLWAGGYLGSGAWATVLTVLPLVASAYQFCRVDAKTDDHFFLGFPSYWNVVAFYAIVLDIGRAGVAITVVVLTVLVFVPVKYLYPSRTEAFRMPTLVFTGVWMLTYAVLLLQMPSPSVIWMSVSLAYVVYYVAVSVLLTMRHRHLTR